MNSFLDPLLNPNLGNYPTPEPDADAEAQNTLVGRGGEFWTRDDLVGVLNHLIHVCHDGQEGYSQAAEQVKSAWLQGLFQNFSTQREQFAIELTNLVEGFGAEPAFGSTVAGVLHRTWLDLRSVITGEQGNDGVILSECERGEDEAKLAYEQELNRDLPEPIYHVVLSQYHDILRAHNQVLEMRDAFPR